MSPSRTALRPRLIALLTGAATIATLPVAGTAASAHAAGPPL